MSSERSYSPSPQEWRERLLRLPEPCTGRGCWDTQMLPEGIDSGYELAAEQLAHALLIVAEERPELLRFADDEDSWARADNRKLWDAAKERWPGLNDWLGGITGFQFGWAHNIVRYVVGVDAVGNPAIVTIGTKENR